MVPICSQLIGSFVNSLSWKKLDQSDLTATNLPFHLPQNEKERKQQTFYLPDDRSNAELGTSSTHEKIVSLKKNDIKRKF